MAKKNKNKLKKIVLIKIIALCLHSKQIEKMEKIKTLYEDLAKSFSTKKKIEKELSVFLGVEIKDLEFWCTESEIETERISVIDENGEVEVETFKTVIIKKRIITYFVGEFRHNLNKNLYPEFYQILIKLKNKTL